jgi:hypothetical protein
VAIGKGAHHEAPTLDHVSEGISHGLVVINEKDNLLGNHRRRLSHHQIAFSDAETGLFRTANHESSPTDLIYDKASLCKLLIPQQLTCGGQYTAAAVIIVAVPCELLPWAKAKKDTSCTHDRDKYGHDKGYQTATHVPVSSVERVPAVEVETVDVNVRGELVPGVEVVGSVSRAVAKF